MKTKDGLTREIEMEIGGKQGSRLTGRMFGKMMDLLEEESETKKEGFCLTETLNILFLLWVDDVVSSVESKENQEKMLERMNQFAIKHKLSWGEEKCQIMLVGKHKESGNTWKMGNMNIKETKEYKYLGDIITNDGRNKKNLLNRKAKLQATTTNIHTIASSDILNRIETSVLLELHEKISLTSLLSNAESWVLNKGEEEEVEKIEIQALKDLFDLPLHTPNAAIIYTLGTLYTVQRIDLKQLTYLHKVLNKTNSDWTKKALEALEKSNIGWSKKIKTTLNKYDLPIDFNVIKNMHPMEWKRKTRQAIEKTNLERLKQECHKTVDGVQTEKTKTKSILPLLNDPNYRREPRPEITNATKHETKTITTTRYRMLECGKNFKGSLKELCNQCNDTDDENHRLNHCIKWRGTNLYNECDKIDIDLIHSNDINVLRHVISKIGNVWNTKTAHGTMKVPS